MTVFTRLRSRDYRIMGLVLFKEIEINATAYLV